MLAKAPDRVADYLAAIGRLAPTVAERRGSFDQERRLPDVVFNALADEGLFRLWLPDALGGPELSPVEFMTVVEAGRCIGRFDRLARWQRRRNEPCRRIPPRGDCA